MVWLLLGLLVFKCCAGPLGQEQDAQDCPIASACGADQFNITGSDANALLQIGLGVGMAPPEPDTRSADGCEDACSMEYVDNRNDVAPVTLLTVAYGLPAPELAWLQQNRRVEAQLFGYEYCIYTTLDCLPNKPDVGSQKAAGAWAKIAALRSLLGRGRKAVAVIDGDAWITHPQQFEPITEPHFSSGKSVVFTKDCFNHGFFGQKIPGGLNTGVFVSKNDAWAQEFWTRIWEWQISNNDSWSQHWWEQAAVLEYMEKLPKDFESHSVRLETHVMNSCSSKYRQGDFIFHPYDFVGPRKDKMSFKNRVAYMKERFGAKEIQVTSGTTPL